MKEKVNTAWNEDGELRTACTRVSNRFDGLRSLKHLIVMIALPLVGDGLANVAYKLHLEMGIGTGLELLFRGVQREMILDRSH